MKKIRNIIICKLYPFMVPHNIHGRIIKNWDKTWNEFSLVPKGWKKFELPFCRDMARALRKSHIDKKNFYLREVKEKFGILRIYPCCYSDEIREVLRKYEKLSSETCVECGEPATFWSESWVLPWCDHCALSYPNIAREYHKSKNC